MPTEADVLRRSDSRTCEPAADHLFDSQFCSRVLLIISFHTKFFSRMPRATVRRSHATTVVGIAPEQLEARRALAADSSAAPALDTATSVFVGGSLIGPSPVVFGKSEIVGNDVKSFVVTDVPEGSVVEKWDPVSSTWIDVSTEPTTSNPAVLLQLLANRVIHQGDQLRWIPAAGSTGPVAKAFEIIGWDDGTQPIPPDPSLVPSVVQNLAATPTGVGDLAVAWEPSAFGNPDAYTVTMTETTVSGGAAAGEVTGILVTSETSLESSQLAAENAYAFLVTASNREGTSPSAMTSFGPVESIASEPIALQAAVGPGTGEVMLSWEPPVDDGGSAIAFYTATVYRANEQQTVTTSARTATFTGLATSDMPLLFRVRATTFAGSGLPATLVTAADGTRLPLPPSNPFMGLEGTATMHANASSSDATLFPGPGTESLEVVSNLSLNATMPSVLMTENGGLVCVGVGTSITTAQTPIVMLISPETLELLDSIKLIKPESGNLAGGLYNYIDHQNRLVLVNADGVMQWYSNDYDRATDTGSLTLEKSVAIGQPMVVGLVPDYEGRIWFATQGSLDPDQTPALMGYYDPQAGSIATFNLPAGEMVANSISSSPAGVAVATTTAVSIFRADANGSIEQVWREVYENSGVRKPGQLSPGTGSTPVFFGPETGYEYLVITDNATAPNTANETPAEHVNIYSVADGTLVAQTPFLDSATSGTENAPIAVGNRVFVPSTFGYWYPPPSETPSTSVPSLSTVSFAGGFQGMTLSGDGVVLSSNWSGGGVLSSALPRLSLADNLIYTIIVESSTQGEGRTLQTTARYSFAAVDADTGNLVGTPLFVGSNTFNGSSPNYANTGSYTWNTLQMTGVISPSGVFYQGTAGGLFLVRRQRSD